MSEAPGLIDGLFKHLEGFVWGDATGRPHWQRAMIHPTRLLWAVIRDVAEGRVTLWAMSLVYTTLLSLVPLLAISFSILKGFGVHNQIEPFLRKTLEPLGERRDEIVSGILGFVDNIQVGVLGSVGLLMLFYTVITLMQKIELAFNEVWQLNAQRSLAERFKDYLSVIVVGPALVFASLGISATVMSDPLMEGLASIEPVRWVLEVIGRILPILLVGSAFALLYMFVPHTRVRAVPAFTGGLVAGVLWNVVGWAFAGFVSTANNYTAIYSGFATPILFMIWLYVGWLILLVGATIAFYRQHPEYLSSRQLTGHLSAEDRERLALQAVCLIGERFYGQQPPPSAERIASALLVPANAVEQILEPLQRQGLLASTDQDPPGYLPGCPWEDASVHQVLEATFTATRGRRRPAQPDRGPVDEIMRRRTEVSAGAFGALSLKELTTRAATQAAPISPRTVARAPS